MTSLRIFSTNRPSLIGATVLPMSKQDKRIWELDAQRRQKEINDERSN